MIHLYNRDEANIYIEKTNKKISDNIYMWELKVDPPHSYCLEFMGVITNGSIIEAVDPIGGPFISINDTFENNKYQIIKIINATTFWISENNNN